jgi:hypothetical protein
MLQVNKIDKPLVRFKERERENSNKFDQKWRWKKPTELRDTKYHETTLNGWMKTNWIIYYKWINS